MQIHRTKTSGSTWQSSRLIRQKMSYSVLEGTVKFNSANLLTSLFLKKKTENCKLPSVMQQQCYDSQHTMYFTVKESNSWAFSFLVCQTCWKKNNLQSLSGKATAMVKPSKPQPMWLHTSVCSTSSSRLIHLKALPLLADLWETCMFLKRWRWLAQVVAIWHNCINSRTMAGSGFQSWTLPLLNVYPLITVQDKSLSIISSYTICQINSAVLRMLRFLRNPYNSTHKVLTWTAKSLSCQD